MHTTEGLLCVSPGAGTPHTPEEIALSLPVGLSTGTSIARSKVASPAFDPHLGLQFLGERLLGNEGKKVPPVLRAAVQAKVPPEIVLCPRARCRQRPVLLSCSQVPGACRAWGHRGCQ